MSDTENLPQSDSGEEMIDITSLDSALQAKLHRSLYRQECRAWLLWCILGLLIPSCLRPVFDEMSSWGVAVMLVLAIAYACFISFWVISPSQELLLALREKAGAEKSREIEGGFDDSWNSVKDFIPPLLIPPLFILGISALRLFVIY